MSILFEMISVREFQAIFYGSCMDVTPPDISAAHAGFSVLSVGKTSVSPQHVYVGKVTSPSSCCAMF